VSRFITYEYRLRARRNKFRGNCDYNIRTATEWIEKSVFLYTHEKFKTRILCMRPDHLEPESLRWNENNHLHIIKTCCLSNKWLAVLVCGERKRSLGSIAFTSRNLNFFFCNLPDSVLIYSWTHGIYLTNDEDAKHLMELIEKTNRLRAKVVTLRMTKRWMWKQWYFWRNGNEIDAKRAVCLFWTNTPNAWNTWRIPLLIDSSLMIDCKCQGVNLAMKNHAVIIIKCSRDSELIFLQ